MMPKIRIGFSAFSFVGASPSTRPSSGVAPHFIYGQEKGVCRGVSAFL